MIETGTNMIKKIISDYFHHPMSKNVRNIFARWITDPDDAKEKEDALLDEWSNIDAHSILPDSEDFNLHLAYLHKKVCRDKAGKSRRWAWGMAAAAFAAICSLAGIGYHLMKVGDRQEIVRSASSETGKRSFTLPDGSVVWLNTNSTLTYGNRFIDKGCRNVRLEGEGFFEVARDEDHPFVVKMDDMELKVLGTTFDAMSKRQFGSSEVVLKTGKLQISSIGKSGSVVLSPGEKCRRDHATGNLIVEKVPADNYCTWMREEIVFRNAPLENIVTSLEHWYNVRIEYDERDTSAMNLSFTLRPEKMQETFKIVEILSGLKFEQKDSLQFILK